MVDCSNREKKANTPREALKEALNEMAKRAEKITDVQAAYYAGWLRGAADEALRRKSAS